MVKSILVIGALIGLIVAACIPPNRVSMRPILLDIKPGQEIVTAYAWVSFARYAGVEASSRMPPTVDWRENTELDCGNGRGFESLYGLCLRGCYAETIHLAVVARSSLDKRLTDTSLLHELCHAFFLDKDHAVCKDDEPPIAPVRESLKEMGY